MQIMTILTQAIVVITSAYELDTRRYGQSINSCVDMSFACNSYCSAAKLPALF